MVEQQRLGDALVVVLVDDEGLEGRSEVAVVEVLGQLTDQELAVGRLVSSQAVSGIERGDDEVLDVEVAVATKARAGWQLLGLDDRGVVYFQVFVSFAACSRASTLARARAGGGAARGRVIIVAVFIQGAGFDGRTRREVLQPSHLGFEGVHALLELSIDGALLLVACSIVFEQGEQHVDQRGALLRWDDGQWR